MKIFALFTACAALLLASCKKESSDTPELEVTGMSKTVIVGGDAISVYGSGFDPDPLKNKVMFNGVAGEVATATPNRLQVIAPTIANNGNLTVTVGGRSVTSGQTYHIVSLLQGIYEDNMILTSDRQYLLRGDVIFNSKLIVRPGTVIYGEKLSHASLKASDIDFSGTEEQPIVFTSDQPEGERAPGDWKGVNITMNQDVPSGIVQYVRVEYAGYPSDGPTGNALNITVSPASTFQFIQVSYSSGNGIQLNGGLNGQLGKGGFIHHVVALGCAGNDFKFITPGIKAQFGLGLKDPYFAGPFRSNGLALEGTYSSEADITAVSNFTFVGYNPDARNISGVGSTLTSDAGCALRIGSAFLPTGEQWSTNDNIALYNSVMAASWQAAIAVVAPYDYNWNYVESEGDVKTELRNNFIVGTSTAILPRRAGVLGRVDDKSIAGLFIQPANDSKHKAIALHNDTTSALNFTEGKDVLGIKNLVDYSRIHHPDVLPQAGSALLTGASFPSGSLGFSPYFDKNVTYAGAFGTKDWTKGWSNFDPQSAKY